MIFLVAIPVSGSYPPEGTSTSFSGLNKAPSIQGQRIGRLPGTVPAQPGFRRWQSAVCENEKACIVIPSAFIDTVQLVPIDDRYVILF